MTTTLPQTEDSARHLALQYLVLAFSQLRVRDEALRYLEDLLAYLVADPEAPLPEGWTRGELGAAYIDNLRRYGRCQEFDFRWLRDDPVFQRTLERYRARFAPGGHDQARDEAGGEANGAAGAEAGGARLGGTMT